MDPAFEATLALAPPLDAPAEARHRRIARWLRALAMRRPPGPAASRDRSTGLYDRAGLFVAADVLLQGRGEDGAMIVLEFDDLREVRDIYGNAVVRKLVARVVRRLRRVAGRRGIVGRTGPAQFTIVLADTSTAKAVDGLQRGFGKPARLEFDAGNSEIVLVPEVLVDGIEPGEPAQAVHRDVCRELARRRKHERRRLDWLSSERERHSRPMPLPR